MRRHLLPRFDGQTLIIIASVAFAMLLCAFFFNRYVADMLRPNWSNAFTYDPPVQHIDVGPLSDVGLWPKDGGAIVGRGQHWIMDDYSSVSGQPERLWYDGKLIATSQVGFYNYILSPDGQHYAYTEKLIEEGTETREQLVIDGVPYVDGGRVAALYMPNSGVEPYYMCEDCDVESGNALWHGRQKLTELKKDERNAEDETMAFIVAENEKDYCFIHNALGASILLSGKRLNQSGWSYCSPDAKHFVNKQGRNTFPIGNKAVLSVNNKHVASGNIDDIHIDNEGRLSYSKSNGAGGGIIVWHGERYTYRGYSSDGDWLVSPSQNNLLIPLSREGKKMWFLNGKKLNNIKDTDELYLDDTALYVYRFLAK